VRIINGLIVNKIILSEVWFILIFRTIRLLLVSVLNNKGYSVLFLKGKATYIKDNV